MTEQPLLKNRYQLQERLGRGGMAVVYRARDLMLERDVAVKILKQEFSSDPAFHERFRQEAKAAANLSHPNIVTVHDFDYDAPNLYIIMEYVRGKDLNTIIKELGRIEAAETIDLMIKACKGIGYAHRAGLVHCDVKPHNFIVTPDGQLKVTDFGIARALASINPDEEAEVVWGSPQYFSPEQASGSAPSPASDVYSLGVVMYLMVTGQLPFIGKTSAELSRLHRRGKPIPPTEINPFLPADIEKVILKVLAKEPSARYRTADQLGRVLITLSKRIQDAPPAPQPEPKPTSPPRRKLFQARKQEADAPTPTPPPQLERTPPGPTAEAALSTAEEAALPELQIDWAAVFLGLTALTTVLGLIPFWIWVYNVFFPAFP